MTHVPSGRRLYMRKTFGILAVVGVVASLLVSGQISSAIHPRPKGATPFRVSVVPAFKACTTPNRTYGAALAFPSCNPPVQASTDLTVASPDDTGAPANSVASVRLDDQAGVPGPPEDSDVLIKSS